MKNILDKIIKKKIVCPRCNAENKEKNKFCTDCGAPIEQLPDTDENEIEDTNASEKNVASEEDPKSDAEIEKKERKAFKITEAKNYSSHERMDFSGLTGRNDPAPATEQPVVESAGYIERINVKQAPDRSATPKAGGPIVETAGYVEKINIDQRSSTRHYNYTINKTVTLNRNDLDYRYFSDLPEGIFYSWVVEKKHAEASKRARMVAKFIPVDPKYIDHFETRRRDINISAEHIVRYAAIEDVERVGLREEVKDQKGIVLIRHFSSLSNLGELVNNLEKENACMSPRKAALLVKQIATLLDLENNMSHAGLKPENIFIHHDRQDIFQLTDFGLRDLKKIAADYEPRFAAQWEKQEREDPFIDHLCQVEPNRGDIMSLGKLLIFMLLGRKGFYACMDRKRFPNVSDDTARQLLSIGWEAANNRMDSLNELIRKIGELKAFSQFNRHQVGNLRIGGLFSRSPSRVSRKNLL